VTSPVLVGRREELAWLSEALARVRSGGTAALLIGGDAGVGKSRLVSEFGAAGGVSAGAAGGVSAGVSAGAAGGAPVRVLTGRCPELGAVGLPFAPFTAILRDLVRDWGTVGVAVPPGWELIRLLPELGEPARKGNPRSARARLFVQMVSLLEQLARQRPVMLVIEDAHWADESTRDLISFLIDSQRAMDRVLIIVTYRSDELHRGHPLRALLPRLGRLGWVQRTELSGLSRGESAELVGHILGGEPAASLADRIYRRAAGNPLFVEELVRADREPTATPCDLMLAGVRRLPEQTQDVLRAASVGGQRTGRGLLSAVTGMGAEALDAALRPAVAAGLLTADTDGYAFRHSLIGETLHQDLLPGEHTALHHRSAAALEADPSLVPAGRAAIEQAQHWQHAHDPARALSSAWQAAADAGRALACGEQLAMLTRVLELWRSVPDAERLTGGDHAHVLRQAAAAASAAGDRQLGISLTAAARQAAESGRPLAAM
jgi:predicted ATPase